MGWEAGGWWEPQGPSARWGPPTHGKVSAPQKCPSRQFLDDCNLSRSCLKCVSAVVCPSSGTNNSSSGGDTDSQLSFISLRCRFSDLGTPPCRSLPSQPAGLRSACRAASRPSGPGLPAWSAPGAHLPAAHRPEGPQGSCTPSLEAVRVECGWAPCNSCSSVLLHLCLGGSPEDSGSA